MVALQAHPSMPGGASTLDLAASTRDLTRWLILPSTVQSDE